MMSEAVSTGVQILKRVFLASVVSGIGLGVGGWMVDSIRTKLRERDRNDG